MELTMIPLDRGSSFSQYVAKTIQIIEQSGLPYRLGPMGTSIEGEWDELMKLLTDCYRSMEKISDRISIQVKFDCRKGASGRLDGKIESVKNKLQNNTDK